MYVLYVWQDQWKAYLTPDDGQTIHMGKAKVFSDLLSADSYACAVEIETGVSYTVAHYGNREMLS